MFGEDEFQHPVCAAANGWVRRGGAAEVVPEFVWQLYAGRVVAFSFLHHVSSIWAGDDSGKIFPSVR